MNPIGLIVTWFVTSLSLFIISKLPTGVEIDSFQKAMIASLVFGLLNAFLKPILSFFAFPITFLTFGLFAVIINAAIFGLAAALVDGFSLRWGFWSALIGAMLLGFINSLFFRLF
ncbi:MAG: phage holin family protein [Microcystaceae cyanobacterium]|nr:phage holin family protein [Merismopediaceae bacterium]